MVSRKLISILMAALTLLCPCFPCGECCASSETAKRFPSDELELAAERSDVEEAQSALGVALTPSNSSCHACCQSRQPFVAKRQPREYSSDSKCPAEKKPLNCFCGGAVVEIRSELVEGSTELQPGLTPRLSLDLPLQYSLPPEFKSAYHPRANFPLNVSGLEIRCLISSFLN